MINLSYLNAQRILLKSGVDSYLAVKILKKMEEQTAHNKKENLEKSISSYNISPQTKTVLKRAGITRVDQLQGYVDEFGLYALLKIEGIGDMRLRELKKMFNL
ncbi:MAG: hypothetical protein ACI4UE_06200 [Candidatus Scatovivens sp.]